MKVDIVNPILTTWLKLNKAMKTAPESLCVALLEEERNGRRRAQFLRRIHCRLNKMRALRERAELENIARS